MVTGLDDGPDTTDAAIAARILASPGLAADPGTAEDEPEVTPADAAADMAESAWR
jgi:hypothetical protein